MKKPWIILQYWFFLKVDLSFHLFTWRSGYHSSPFPFKLKAIPSLETRPFRRATVAYRRAHENTSRHTSSSPRPMPGQDTSCTFFVLFSSMSWEQRRQYIIRCCCRLPTRPSRSNENIHVTFVRESIFLPLPRAPFHNRQNVRSMFLQPFDIHLGRRPLRIRRGWQSPTSWTPRFQHMFNCARYFVWHQEQSTNWIRSWIVATCPRVSATWILPIGSLALCVKAN